MPVIENCPLDKIAENAHNVRRDVGDVTDLAASIQTMGILEPLVVAPNPGNDAQPFVLIAGHRRLAAARQAGLDRTTVVVRAELLDVASQLEAMLVENLQRVDISPIEEGQAYKQLLAFSDSSVGDIAKHTGRAVATVKGRVSLTALSPTTQDLVHNGDCTLTDALAIAEWAHDPDALAKLEKALGTYDFQHTLHRLKGARELAKKTAMTSAALAHDRVKVIDPPAGWPWNSTEQPLSRIHPVPDDHSTCPGHGAFIEERTGTAVYFCADLDTHHPVEDDNDDTAASSPAAARNRQEDAWEFTRAAQSLGFKNAATLSDAERRQVQVHLDEQHRVKDVLSTAAAVRWAHVDTLLSRDRKPPKDAPALLVAMQLVRGEQIEESLPLLDVPAPDNLDADSTELALWFIAQVAAAKPETVARLALMALRYDLEAELTQPYRSGSDWSNDPDYPSWFAFLVRNGYPITPEETAKVTPPAEDGDTEA